MQQSLLSQLRLHSTSQLPSDLTADHKHTNKPRQRSAKTSQTRRATWISPAQVSEPQNHRTISGIMQKMPTDRGLPWKSVKSPDLKCWLFLLFLSGFLLFLFLLWLLWPKLPKLCWIVVMRVLKDTLLECCTQHASKFGKLTSGHRIRKGQFSFQSPQKGNAKECSNYCTMLSSHTLAK